MKHLKVSTRLLLLVGTLSLLLVAVGVLGLWTAHRTNDSLKSVYADRTVPAGQLGEIKSLMLRSRLAVSIAVMDPTPEVIRERAVQIDANVAAIARLWKDYSATYLTADEARLAKAFVEDRNRLEQEGLLPAAAALRAGHIEEARRLASITLPALFRRAEPGIDALSKLQLDEAKREYDSAEVRFEMARSASIAAIVAGLAFGALFGLAIIRSLLRELGAEPAQAAALAQSVAQGDLSVAISLRQGDQSSLMAQLSRMRDGLTDVVGEVRRNADSVATASAQIAQGNGDLSGRTEEQASALQQTAATMEQLNTTVTHNAASARQASQLALGASSVASQGGDEVAQVVQTMKRIEESSTRIGDIISVIDGIAFQTNILALNAAVEAARAGDQGRGFAVVASEVRTLARRSAEAARAIKSLINASVERVEQGSAQADRAGRTMAEVVGSIQRVSDLVSEISAASTEQSAGVAQVGQAVHQMDQTTQQNAALVEESAAAAESLKHQAQQLVRAVSVFKLSSQPA